MYRGYQLLLTFTVAAVFCAATAYSAGVQTPKPILIVWAKTDLPEQGKPTLDLLDLERYFVKQLSDRGMENVIPATTSKLNTAPNVFMLELYVDAMRTASRARRDPITNVIEDDPIFHVELSLAVKHRRTGQAMGGTGERREYHFNSIELTEIGPKQVAIYSTADKLADRFVSGALQGQFGEQWRALQTPPEPTFQQWQIALAAGITFVVLVFVAVGATSSPKHRKPSKSSFASCSPPGAR